MPEIHEPRVWIERTNLERARPILETYERHLTERRAANASAPRGGLVGITCEDCGKPSSYPQAQLGSV